MNENSPIKFGSIILYVISAFFIGLLIIDVYILLVTKVDISVTRLYFLALVSALFLAAAGLPWDKGRRLLRSVILVGFLVEALLQIIALGGWLPGKLSLYRHIPYGRVYFTSEGYSNTVMNRYGWHAPEFTFRSKARRIAVVGDSFVEAVQVHPRDTLPVKLAGRLESVYPSAFDVIGLGNSGHGPAQYLEFIRYAREEFGIDEAIVMVFVGNDFRNLLRSQITHDLGYGIYHHFDLDSEGNLTLSADDQEKLRLFRRRLARNHEPLAMNLSTIIGQHLFVRHIGQELVARAGDRWAARMASNQPQANEEPGWHATNRAGDWYDGFVFQRPNSADATKAFRLAQGIFAEMKAYADSNHIKLRVVSIPHFPSWWYKQHHGRPWNRRMKSFDFGQPERELRSILEVIGIPYLEVGKEWEIAQQDPEVIKSFYFYDGAGHFTGAGHDHFAKLISDRFYTSNP